MRKNAIGCKTAPWRREDVGYADRLENMSKWSAGKQRSVTACSTVVTVPQIGDSAGTSG